MRPDGSTQDAGGGPESHVEELLDAYRTGELDAARRAAVESHLVGCASCRAELSALRSWGAAFERGYEGRRAAASGLEPDWAAQRAEIVARTSGRARRVEARSLWRWAPQVALVALAALIVGIVWRENPRGPMDSGPPARSERAAASDGESRDEAEGQAPVGTRLDQKELEERDAAAPAAERVPAAPPAGRDRSLEAPAVAQENQAREADESRFEREKALADQAAPSLAAPPAPEVARFERDARAALAGRDTVAARRALALWADTLAAGVEVAGPAPALADSLEDFLEDAE